MSTCFVILHYMAVDETTACVKSIQDNIHGDKKIVVVDNASPNGSGKELVNIYKDNADVTVLLAEGNLGYAKGNNLGYDYAMTNFKPDFCVVMNNDMVIEQADFIDEIEKSYAEYKYAILGPDIFSTRIMGHQNPQYSRKVPTLKELKKKYIKYTTKYYLRFVMRIKAWLKRNEKASSVKPMDNFTDHVVDDAFLHGSCYVFSKDFMAVNPHECFFSKTFMYMEAEILAYQARKNGLKMIYYPNIKVIHHEDVATNKSHSKKYAKSLFSIKCLRQSTREYIKLMEGKK